MEATDPTSGQVFLEHVSTGESRWKLPGNQTATERRRGVEAAAGAAGPADWDAGAGQNKMGGAATSSHKVGTWNEEPVT